MLTWQWRQILGELQEIQRHSVDKTCPCSLADIGENCLAKHTLGLSHLAHETASMDESHRDMLYQLGDESIEKHEAVKAFVCDPHKHELPGLIEWSRQWRKRLERFYYHASCGIPHAKLHEDPTAHMECPLCSLMLEPKDGAAPVVKISGTCSAKSGCSIKVKGEQSSTVRTSPADLPNAIDKVIREIEAQKKRGSKLTFALGSTSLTRYEFEYRVVDASELVVSHDPITFEANPGYPQELQPRLRGRAANRVQVQTMAQALDADALLSDFHSIDRGAPIVGPDNVVESGNGRVMAIKNAITEAPASYERYKGALLARVEEYDIDGDSIVVPHPVLVRVRLTDVPRRTFVEEANASTVLAPSAVETARADAGKISQEMLSYLVVGEDQGIEDALRSRSNTQFVTMFLSKLSTQEQAALVDASGVVSQDGVRRMVMAVFLNAFPGDAGLKLAERYFESTDPNVRNVFNGIASALGSLSKSEALARAGSRQPDLSIGEDLALTVAVYGDIKKTPGMTVDRYMNQGQLFGRALDRFQEELLLLIEQRSRSAKRIGRLLREWAKAVIDSPAPGQGVMFPGQAPTKDEVLEVAVRRSDEAQSAALFEDVLAHLREEHIYAGDPVLKKTHAALCRIGALPCLGEPETPDCSASKKKHVESCVVKMKAANRGRGCSEEMGTGSEKCPDVYAVCASSVGCHAKGKATMRNNGLMPDMGREHAFAMCSCKTTGKLVRGSTAVGDQTSVSLEVQCPHGYRALGIFHTHPGGHPRLSQADVREAQRLGLHHMCVGVPQTGDVHCYVV